MLLEELARTSAEVAATRSRLAKKKALAACLRRMRPDEVRVGVSYLSGRLPHGAVGVGWASLRELPPPAPPPATLELLDADRCIREVADAAGTGSQRLRREALGRLFGRATEPERRFLIGLLLGELRQGALEGVMTDAIAAAADVPVADVRRAAMLAGDLSEAAAAALREGAAGLARFRLTLGRPVQPMLAHSAPDLASALERISPAALEWKVDGARLQVHRAGGRVRAFTRNLADVTERVPEVVGAVLALPLDAIILDGEVVALRRNEQPQAFQVTMGRFGSSIEVEDLERSVPLSAFFFDCLHLDGDDLIDRGEHARFAALKSRLPGALLVPRIVTGEPGAAAAFMDDAIERGHEGVVVKSLEAPYEAGRRGAGWLKVKRAATLDLVVLAAEWGHGRRQGWLSNLHLGARDPATGGFVMLGKTFKGMTDEMLAWQTERFIALETNRHGAVVEVRPELVVEVAFDGIQRSTRYPGGVALRFARVKGYRPDKSAAEADTIDTVRALHPRGDG